MNHGERKQPAVTSFFSPAPKRRAPDEHSVSADKNMQLPHDSMGQETRPPRPETEVCTSDHLRIHLRGPMFSKFSWGGMPPDPPRARRLRRFGLRPQYKNPPFSNPTSASVQLYTIPQPDWSVVCLPIRIVSQSWILSTGVSRNLVMSTQ